MTGARTRRWLTGALLAGVWVGVANGQSLQQRLDEDRFLRGIADLQLRELLHEYFRLHPPRTPADEDAYRLAAARLNVAAAESEEAFLTAVERVLELRAAMIEEHDRDPRLAVWLADQAADLYFELLPVEGADFAAIFGMPSPEQIRRAQRVAREMFDLSDEASIAVEEAILDLESSPDAAEAPAQELRRRRLVRNERERRIPFLRGVGAALHALLNVDDEVERRRLFELADALLSPLADALEGSLRHRALIYAALARMQLGQFGSAETALRRVLDDSTVEPRDALLARLVTVAVETVRASPESGLRALGELEGLYTHPDDLPFRLLLADMRCRLTLASGRNRAEAFRSYSELIESFSGAARRAAQDAVFDRLAHLAGDVAAQGDAPPMLAIAQAARLTERAVTRRQGIDALEALLARSDLDPGERATAMFRLARALHEDGRTLEAARRFFELARQFPADIEAERAVELAAALAVEARRVESGDAEAAALVMESADLMIRQYPTLDSLDRWRVVAGHLALERGELDRAQALLEAIMPDSESHPDARVLQLRVVQARARHVASPGERIQWSRTLINTADGVHDALERADRDRADPQFAARLEEMRASVRVMTAEAHVAVGESDRALDVLEGIESKSGLPGAIVAEAMRVRINALQAVGRADELSDVIDRLIAAAGDGAGSILASTLQVFMRQIEALLDAGRHEEALDRGGRELVPLAAGLDRLLASSRAEVRDTMNLHRLAADGYRLGGRFEEALRLYDRLAAVEPDALEIVFGRAECLFALDGDGLAEAMRIYKRIAAARDEARDRFSWQAHLRMLQILDRTGRNTNQIAPQINRLRQRDPALGGPRFRQSFEVLLGKWQ